MRRTKIQCKTGSERRRLPKTSALVLSSPQTVRIVCWCKTLLNLSYPKRSLWFRLVHEYLVQLCLLFVSNFALMMGILDRESCFPELVSQGTCWWLAACLDNSDSAVRGPFVAQLCAITRSTASSVSRKRGTSVFSGDKGPSKCSRLRGGPRSTL